MVNNSSFTTTWSGSDAVVEDADVQYDATLTYTMGHINLTAAGSSTLTLAELITGTKNLSAASFYPS